MIGARGVGRGAGPPLLVLLFAAAPAVAQAQTALSLLEVPFISQSEALCGGAAAAMVLRYYGERGITADDFAHLVDRSAAGIRTTALERAVRTRGWTAVSVFGTPALVEREIAQRRPVIALIEDRPGALHYVVVVGWHSGGVVLHDPARAPYRVTPVSEFVRRWRASREWAMVIAPAAASHAAGESPPSAAGSVLPSTSRELSTAGSRNDDPPGGRESALAVTPCDALVAEGVRLAQANDLARAEQTLADAAHRCPGAAPRRELAGVRLLQRRWPEATELASEAVRLDAHDAHAWRLLATSRFVQNDPTQALEAWNHIGEPVVDLIHVDGLMRTRHRIVELHLGLIPGDVLTADTYARARRRLADVPAFLTSTLHYRPVPDGRAELRASVVERAAVPRGALALAATALETAATREVSLALVSPSGGGERLSIAWRFWPHRPRYGIRLDAPASWGGVWHVDGYSEQQPFTDLLIARSDRMGARLGVSDWASSWLRWDVDAGLDRWANEGRFGAATAAVRVQPANERWRAEGGFDAWFGKRSFVRSRALATWSTSALRRGTTLAMTAVVEAAGSRAPLDLWPGGDTGHIRSLLLRAHPLLDSGRIRVERVGRLASGVSIETQRWRAVGPFDVAAASFLDIGRTGRRRGGETVTDADVGVGARLALAAHAGLLRIDLAHGLRAGENALSVAWSPAGR